MAEIPGLDPASLNVSGQSHTLTIKGERKRETVSDAAGTTGANDHSVSSPVPSNFLMNSISTRRRVRAGMLTVRVPKAESGKPRQIAVKPA